MQIKLRISAIALALSTCSLPAMAGVNDANTSTPIKHVIVVIGENRTFDNLFATYKPSTGQTVKNLLSQQIVRENGDPGSNFKAAAQAKFKNTTGKYQLFPQKDSDYLFLPQPTIGGIRDIRYSLLLPNGPFQITKGASWSGMTGLTGDPAHRFFQMWQQTGGTNEQHDHFVWVAKTVGTGGASLTANPIDSGQGGELMGFYNMAAGDAPFLKSLADAYAISDNFHQSIMGGTGMNFFSISTGGRLPVFNVNGALQKPPTNQIENPDPLPLTANFYQNDGYFGGSYVNCSDRNQAGVAAIRDFLSTKGLDPKCDRDAYYLVNNYSPGYDIDGNPKTIDALHFNYPPQTVPNIGELLSAGQVSWKWYTGGRNVEAAAIELLGEQIGGTVGNAVYNALGDPLVGSANIMTTDLKRNLQGFANFVSDVKGSTLPAVSFVVPDNLSSGHALYSTPYLYESFLKGLVKLVKSNPALWAETAIVITTDEGGGYFDSGTIQPLDFFGNGPRIPLIVVSPYAKVGHVDHVYHDHASILKFIEKNWRLPTVSTRSRDNLPNPKMDNLKDPYIPSNSPAIGDLSTLFNF